MVLASTGTGDIIPNATVTVRNPGTTVNISETIYVADDPDASQYTNGAFFTSATGLVTFYLTNQKRVDVLFTKTGYTSVTIPVDVQKSALVSGESVATSTIWDAKGDLAAGTGADAASRLAVGANDTALTADSAQATGLKWVAYQALSDAAGEIGYAQVTANQLAIGTTNTDLTGLSVTVACDGVTPIFIEGYVLVSKNTNPGRMVVSIYEGASQLQTAAIYTGIAGGGGSVTIRPGVRLNPSAGDHTYKLVAGADADTMDALAGAIRPNFISVTRL